MKIFLLLMFVSAMGLNANVANANSCRSAYIKVYDKIKFHPEHSVDMVISGPLQPVAAAITTGGGAGVLATNTVNPALGTTVSVIVGGAVLVPYVAGDAITKYEQWWSNGMGVVLAIIEESQVGVGQHIKEIAASFKTSPQFIVDAVSELDSSGALCQDSLATEVGLHSLINQKLQIKILNSGVLK